MSKLDDLHLAIASAHHYGDSKMLEALLPKCADAECSTCGWLLCPFDDALHFHHDGCPSCTGVSSDEAELFVG